MNPIGIDFKSFLNSVDDVVDDSAKNTSFGAPFHRAGENKLNLFRSHVIEHQFFCFSLQNVIQTNRVGHARLVQQLFMVHAPIVIDATLQKKVMVKEFNVEVETVGIVQNAI